MAKQTNTEFKLELTEAGKDTVVGYNGFAKPLKDRNDLHVLMDMALSSGDRTLLTLFVNIPSPEQWSEYRANLFTEK